MLRKTFALSFVVFLVSSLFFSVIVDSASASNSQIYWGAFVGPTHLGNSTDLQTFESAVGKDISIWNWFQFWNRPADSQNNPAFDTLLMNQCRENGIIPMVSWAPESGWSNFPFTNLESILDGSQDAYLTAWGQASAAWGHPYFVRMWWEFTGSWTGGVYPFGNGNTGASEFVQAWQYVVNKVRAAGGTNISWVWCPADIGDSVSTLQSLYPGDNYVDWVGTDVYPTTGQSFSSAAQTEINSIRSVAPNKPMMLAELGYPTGSNSGSWWKNMLTNVLPNNYPYINAVCVWQDPSDDVSWNVIDSNTLSGFQSGIGSSYYSSKISVSLSNSPINAIGKTLNSTYPDTSQPTGYPTPTTTNSAPVSQSSRLGVDAAVIFGVVAAVLVVVVLARKSISSIRVRNAH